MLDPGLRHYAMVPTVLVPIRPYAPVLKMSRSTWLALVVVVMMMDAYLRKMPSMTTPLSDDPTSPRLFIPTPFMTPLSSCCLNQPRHDIWPRVDGDRGYT